MLKKVIPIIISLCLIFSISVMAENEMPTSGETVPEALEQVPQGDRGNMGIPPSGDMQDRPSPTMPNGKPPREGMNRGQKPSGEVTPPQNTESGNTEKVTQSTSAVEESETSTGEQNNHNTEENPQFEGRMPGGMQGGLPGNMQINSGQTQDAEPMTFGSFVKAYSTPITSVILLALAFIFVIFYRRKNY